MGRWAPFKEWMLEVSLFVWQACLALDDYGPTYFWDWATNHQDDNDAWPNISGIRIDMQIVYRKWLAACLSMTSFTEGYDLFMRLLLY